MDTKEVKHILATNGWIIKTRSENLESEYIKQESYIPDFAKYKGKIIIVNIYVDQENNHYIVAMIRGNKKYEIKIANENDTYEHLYKLIFEPDEIRMENVNNE